MNNFKIEKKNNCLENFTHDYDTTIRSTQYCPVNLADTESMYASLYARVFC